MGALRLLSWDSPVVLLTGASVSSLLHFVSSRGLVDASPPLVLCPLLLALCWGLGGALLARRRLSALAWSLTDARDNIGSHPPLPFCPLALPSLSFSL